MNKLIESLIHLSEHDTAFMGFFVFLNHLFKNLWLKSVSCCNFYFLKIFCPRPKNWGRNEHVKLYLWLRHSLCCKPHRATFSQMSETRTRSWTPLTRPVFFVFSPLILLNTLSRRISRISVISHTHTQGNVYFIDKAVLIIYNCFFSSLNRAYETSKTNKKKNVKLKNS